MAFDHVALRNMPPRESRQVYTARDTVLYALGLGIGARAIESSALLPFVYEEGLLALPTMGAVLALPGMFLRSPEIGANWRKLLHGEQSLEIHRPIQPAASVRSVLQVLGVYDRGPDKGALVHTERDIYDEDGDVLIATLRQSSVLRGDGGFGGPPPPTTPRVLEPSGEPDFAVDHRTRPEQALLYRLSGDYNPLHADPQTASIAGFERPILHGLCTFGIAGFAALECLCGFDPSRLRKLSARFSSPTYPGETIRTEFWRDGEGAARFRALAVERRAVVLTLGRAEFCI